MELFENLPGPLKNIIRKQAISCDEVTEYGAKCGEKFIYSVNEFLIPERKDDLKKVMMDCTKFCLKHLSDLAINGELVLGYEKKDKNKDKNKERKLEPIFKEAFSIIGLDNENVDVIDFNFTFDPTGIMKDAYFHFPDYIIKDYDKKDIEKSEKGYPSNIKRYKVILRKERKEQILFTRFQKGCISKIWRKIIINSFKMENITKIKIYIEGFSNNMNIPKKPINSILTLGNLIINDAEIEQDEDTDVMLISASKIIEK